jgi:beta-glucosidase-like glycosyl hydrolase
VGAVGRLRAALVAAAVMAVAATVWTQAPVASSLDRDAERWVERTLQKMSLDQKIGQLIVPSLESRYVSNDSEVFDALATLAREYHVGGFHLFGARDPTPDVLLNPTYGAVVLGDPFSAASTLNRLQALADTPLMNTADFERGIGMRLFGGTTFPSMMAFGAAGDERLAFEAGRITGRESRAVGVHVDFAPVADVNNNARNPVINTRSFGEDPARVAALASAFARGLQEGGTLATLKHFPGHGDTEVDSHLGLPLIAHPRARLDQIELAPFRAGIAAGTAAVMIGHIELPAIDPSPRTPATFSAPAITGLLRGELGFRGLVYTDSMAMDAVTELLPAGEAGVRAVKAGSDQVLDSRADVEVFNALKAAVERREIDERQITDSVRRVLAAKARLGLHKERMADLGALPARVGGRAHDAVADEVSRRSITLLKDEQGSVPLRVPRDAAVLYLSVLDYPGGWRIAAPSRTFEPELSSRWPNLTAIELSDRTTAAELDLVAAMAARFDAIVVSIFVRTASLSGRMDLSAPAMRLVQRLAVASTPARPLVACLFGNPYVSTFLPELPAVLLTYDLYDRPERSAVRALAGEAPITGRLPITLPGFFPIGHGLDRQVATAH